MNSTETNAKLTNTEFEKYVETAHDSVLRFVEMEEQVRGLLEPIRDGSCKRILSVDAIGMPVAGVSETVYDW